MREDVTAGQVLAAAAAVTTTFVDVPREPLGVQRAAALAPRESGEIVARYARHGFAVVQLGAGHVTAGTLLELAQALDLGAPFVPPLYATGGRAAGASAAGGSAAGGVSRISAARNTGTADDHHPSFGRTGGQELHCDGTLQPIGYVKTSLLGCETPAAFGGETTLFNASAAYAQLAVADPAAAAALAAPGVMVRQANINGCTDSNAGSAFTLRDGRLVCGYSVTQTDTWAVPDGVDAADLYRGAGFLRHASLPGGPFFAQLKLAAGQVIAFDNTRISHGRTPYRDAEDRRRCLYRSLHLRHPRARVPAAAGAGGVLHQRPR
jgi:alpha-ketoglutarate-dependent taurine dioxygenase